MGELGHAGSDEDEPREEARDGDPGNSPSAVSEYSTGPMKANTIRNERSGQLMSNRRLIAGPKPVRYSSAMCASSAATVSRNGGRMISGATGFWR